MTTIALLESQRRRWEPVPISLEPLEFDYLLPTVQRCIALGLHLEINVAEFVGEAIKKELPVTADVLKTMGKNIADERRHFDAFTFAAKVFTPTEDMLTEAEKIGFAWETHSSHPLEKAATSEAGVFLTTLFVLARFGGHSLANMAGDIATDEFRHTVVNWGVLKKAGMKRSAYNNLRELRRQTLDYVFQDTDIPELGINLDFFLESSDLLVETGKAPELSALSEHYIYKLPFETSNATRY